MAKLTSFKDVAESMFYDDIYIAVGVYIENNHDRLDTRSFQIQTPDEATLSDIRFNSINITDSQGNVIDFDVVVIAEIEIAETVKRNRESDGAEQWFRVSCSAELEDGIQNFQISGLEVYSPYKKNTGNRLSEYLVPIIYKEQLDDVAETFLAKYYPEALKAPMAVPPYEVAERMGLKVQAMHLTKNCSVFGQVYFSDCEVQYYDQDARTYKPLMVERGTILLDPNVYFMRTVGSMNNTVIHECVHWDLHKKFFELEKMYNQEAKSISCQVKEGLKPEKKRSPLDWMEWHANLLAPRILMPLKQTRLKIEELLEKNKYALQTENMADIVESVVFELADFFDVSKQAAKIRMIDLGYTEAMGVLTYIDGHYISNYTFDRNALRRSQTYSIGIQDAIVEFVHNPNFRTLVKSGKYLYVDSHFCINDSKYIRYNDDGNAWLTDYARQHIDECCLIFDLEIRRNEEYGAQFYTECVLFKNVFSDTIVEAKFSDSVLNQQIESRASEMTRIRDDVRLTTEIMRKLPPTLSGTLKAHMERLQVTVELLEERSLVKSRTIQRLRNNKGAQHRMSTIVAICIGLQLNPVFSQDLIRKAGLTFQVTEEQIIYQVLLNSFYQNSIYECNEVLAANGFKPLVKEE